MARVSKIYLPAFAMVLLFAWAGVTSGRGGLARLFSEYASNANSLEANRRALELNSSDVEARFVEGQLLADSGEVTLAIAQLEQATRLRPDDYFLWQELGRVRDENGDADGAIEALRKAIKLAPHYAQPHWQLGNVLLRSGDVVEAFAEMRFGAKSDPTLLPLLIDLAGGFFDGDTTGVTNAVSPDTDLERIALARSFLSSGKVAIAVKQLEGVKDLPDEDRRAMVAELIKSGDLEAARNLWANGVQVQAEFFNGSFESAVISDDTGFGWQPTALRQTIKIAQDPGQARDGQRSLRLEYTGNFDESTPVISQLVLVSPSTPYRLSFASRTENLSSAGLPIVTVTEVSGTQVALAPLAGGTSGWSEASVEFETGESVKAVKITVQRQACNVKPCPIVGKLWLDDFRLVKR
jgi:hypothetical protein